MFNFLVRGSGAHARNFSLLLTPGEVRLAPLYDLNTTLAFGAAWADRMAVCVGGEDRFEQIGNVNWLDFARELGLAPDWALAELTAMATARTANKAQPG
jgi:serine/threonine-protein kinase HipA